MEHYITWMDQTSAEYGLTIESVMVTLPAPRKVETTIPYCSGTVDLSHIAGYKVYDNRTVTVKMWKKCKNEIQVTYENNRVSKWLLSNLSQCRLEDTHDPEYYFWGDCISVDVQESTKRVSHITATFSCAPYRVNRVTGEEVI